MLTPERIMELWQSSHRYSHYNDHEGISHGCNRPDPIAFARAIECECAEEAARIADSFRCGSCGMDGKAAARIRQILGDPSKGVTVEFKSALMQNSMPPTEAGT